VIPDGALAGVRVLDLSHFLAGQYAGAVLADLGADVISLEDSDRPTHSRSVGPHFLGGESLYFLALNWGKRSFGIGMSQPGSRAVLEDLVRAADVVLDNYRPGITKRLGLDHDALTEVNPKIVSCSITGFGESGPYAERPGYDYTVQALSGVMSLTGEPDGPPGKAGVSYVDHSAALAAAMGICAALLKRERTGRGKHVEVALADVQVSMLTYLAAWQQNTNSSPERTANASHPSLLPAQNFATRDGYISVFVGNDAMWTRFVAAIDNRVLAGDQFTTLSGRSAARAELLPLLEDVFKRQDSEHWVELLNSHGVACAPVNTVGEALEDPHIRARGLVRTAKHDAYGAYRHVAGPVPSMSVSPKAGAPPMAHDTETILLELGYEHSAIERLAADGAVVLGPSRA
jgi:crotonobetainyl-CoA:carnitine CoA-transferase CaiB-like acyl-CoA transferase